MINIFPYLLAGIIPILINFILTPILLKIAHTYRWYDETDFRKTHTGNIPRIGGMGIAFSFAASIIIMKFIKTVYFPNLSGYLPLNIFWAIVVGSVIVNLIGLLDDFTNLRPLYKLIGQFIGALLVVLSGKYFTEYYIPFFNISVKLGIFSQLITIIWIIGVTNAINLIDGLDGLSGGVSSIILFFMALSALVSGNLTQAVLLFMLFGAVLSFVMFNFPPAKIFMGDSGSLFLGFFLACIPLYTFTGNISAYSLILSISFMIIPIIDTVSAILRRKIKGVPFHSPDMEHLHHKLIGLGLSTKKVLGVIYLPTFILSLAAFMFIYTGKIEYIYLNIILWIIVILLVFILSHTVKKRNTSK